MKNSKLSISLVSSQQFTSKDNNPKKKNLKGYNSDSDISRRIRTKITIREQKCENEIYAEIDNINNQSDSLKKSIDKKMKENMGKFKLNNLKEIFEVIFSKCNSIEDIQNLDKFGISESMKDNIILPCLHIIQERKLEFNFQNFYLIANEIMNMIF